MNRIERLRTRVGASRCYPGRPFIKLTASSYGGAGGGEAREAVGLIKGQGGLVDKAVLQQLADSTGIDTGSLRRLIYGLQMQSNSRTRPITIDAPRGAAPSGQFDERATKIAMQYRSTVNAFGRYSDAVQEVERLLLSGVPPEALEAAVQNFQAQTRHIRYRSNCKEFFSTGEWQGYVQAKKEPEAQGRDQVDEVARRLAARGRG